MDTLVALIIIGVCVSLFRKSGVKQSRKKSVPYRRGQVNPKPIHFEPTDPVSVTRVTPAPTVDPEPFCQEAEGFSDEGQGMSHSLERAPLTRPGDYVGSLNVDSDEGRDLCDPELGHGHEEEFTVQHLPDEPNPYEETSPMLSLDSRAIVQGVVMNEILIRPGQRKWGRRG